MCHTPVIAPRSRLQRRHTAPRQDRLVRVDGRRHGPSVAGGEFREQELGTRRNRRPKGQHNVLSVLEQSITPLTSVAPLHNSHVISQRRVGLVSGTALIVGTMIGKLRDRNHLTRRVS